MQFDEEHFSEFQGAEEGFVEFKVGRNSGEFRMIRGFSRASKKSSRVCRNLQETFVEFQGSLCGFPRAFRCFNTFRVISWGLRGSQGASEPSVQFNESLKESHAVF